MRSAVLAGVLLLAVSCAGNVLPEEEWWQTMALEMTEDIPVTRDLSLTRQSTATIIAKYGYPSETHTIRTDDGYILTMDRIPNRGKPVVYLQHGILSSAADWVILGPEKALPFILHDAGYDVWLGNSRGSTYSRNHATLKPEDSKFWDFSWHEIGIYDIPACIDYILEQSGQKDLYYVGHSQGTTVFYVLMSMKPEYNAKVKAMFALAPVAFMDEVRSIPIRILSKGVYQIGWIAKMIGMNEFLPNGSFLTRLASMLCTGNWLSEKLCTNVLFLITGYDSEQLNTTMLPTIMENIPAGSSTKQLLHYGQLVVAGRSRFRMYDYGWISNMFKYKQLTPPDYDLNKVTVPVHLVYGENDLLAVPTAVSVLKNRLRNVAQIFRVPFDKFNHMDFLYAKDCRTLLYDHLLEHIRLHDRNETCDQAVIS